MYISRSQYMSSHNTQDCYLNASYFIDNAITYRYVNVAINDIIIPVGLALVDALIACYCPLQMLAIRYMHSRN